MKGELKRIEERRGRGGEVGSGCVLGLKLRQDEQVLLVTNPVLV